jgi:hypothetical protein
VIPDAVGATPPWARSRTRCGRSSASIGPRSSARSPDAVVVEAFGQLLRGATRRTQP